jgi:hypothetical protein
VEYKKLLLPLILFLLIVNVSATFGNSLDRGLVSYYTMEEASGTSIFDRVTSNLANNTMLLSADNRTLNGKIGKAIGFVAGSSQKAINTTPQGFISGNQDITVSFWAKRTGTGKGLFSLGSSANGDSTYLFIGQDIASYGGGAFDLSLSIMSSTNTWYHIILMTDTSGNLTVWQNGAFSAGKINTPTSFIFDKMQLGFTEGMGYYMDGYMDEVGVWNRTLTTSEITQLYNSGNGLSYNIELNSPVNNYKTIMNKSVLFNCSIAETNILNLSLIIEGQVNYTVYNTTSNQNNLSLFIDRQFTTLGEKTWSCISSTLTDTISSATRNINVSNFVANSEVYNFIATEGTNELFILNLTIDKTETLNSVYLFYNNTLYSPSIAQSGDDYIISKTLTTPTLNSDTNISFNWIINLDSGTYNTTAKNQSVLNIGIDNCASNTLKILNLTLKDEELQTLINGTDLNSSIDVDINIYALNTDTRIINYSKSYNRTNNALVCLNANALNNSNYSMDVEIRYSSSGYAPEFYNIQKYHLNNLTAYQVIDLLELKSSDNTNFKITFKDSNFNAVSDALIFIQRKYVGDGVFKTVEIPKTDSSGQAIGHFDTDSVLYSIIVQKNGIVLGTFNNIAVICEDVLIGNCNINLNQLTTTTGFTNYNSKDNVSYITKFNETSRTLSVIFASSNGLPVTMFLNVTKYNAYQNVSLCTNSLTSSSGTLNCLIPSAFGNLTIVSYLYKDNNLLSRDIFIMNNNIKEKVGSDGIIFVIFMLLVIPFFFISSLIGFLVGIIITLVIGSILMLYSTSSWVGVTSALMWLIIVIAIVIYKISKRNREGGYG